MDARHPGSMLTAVSLLKRACLLSDHNLAIVEDVGIAPLRYGEAVYASLLLQTR